MAYADRSDWLPAQGTMYEERVNMKLDWMELLVSDCSKRISKPFNVQIGGERWRVATDGRAMVAVEIGDLPFPEGDPEAPDVTSFFREFETGNLVWTGDMLALRERVAKSSNWVVVGDSVFDTSLLNARSITRSTATSRSPFL